MSRLSVAPGAGIDPCARLLAVNLPSILSRRRVTVASLLALGVAGLGACASPVAVINAITPSDTHRLLPDLPYRPGSDDPRQRLDVYQPLTPAGAAPSPVVVFFYGGSWNSGDRKAYRFVGEALAARGIVVVIADYRLYPQVSYPTFLEDCALATAWTLREIGRFGGDAGRVLVMGHSAGAYNAAMIALDPRWLALQGLQPAALHGWIGLAGPYDFLPVDVPEVKPVFHHPNEPPDSQPLAHVADTAGSLRAFLGVSRRDTYVNPQRNSVRLAQALRDRGAKIELRWYENTSHLTLIGAIARPLRWLDPVLDDVVGFIGGTPA